MVPGPLLANEIYVVGVKHPRITESISMKERIARRNGFDPCVQQQTIGGMTVTSVERRTLRPVLLEILRAAWLVT